MQRLPPSRMVSKRVDGSRCTPTWTIQRLAR
ncbi:hypothetical protein HaLaN_20432, partial [Haematococcus lacustris]